MLGRPLATPATRAMVVRCADSRQVSALARFAAPEFKVLRSVVGPIAVYVVNLLVRLQEPAKFFLHCKSVVKQRPRAGRARVVGSKRQDIPDLAHVALSDNNFVRCLSRWQTMLECFRPVRLDEAVREADVNASRCIRLPSDWRRLATSTLADAARWCPPRRWLNALASRSWLMALKKHWRAPAVLSAKRDLLATSTLTVVSHKRSLPQEA